MNCKLCGNLVEKLAKGQSRVYCSDRCAFITSCGRQKYNRLRNIAAIKRMPFELDLFTFIRHMATFTDLNQSITLVDEAKGYTMENLKIGKRVSKQETTRAKNDHEWIILEKVKNRTLYKCKKCGIKTYIKLTFRCLTKNENVEKNN